jgi:hypothetical protein
MYQNQFFKKIENWQVSEHRCTRAKRIYTQDDNRQVSIFHSKNCKTLVFSILPNPSHEE